MIERPPPFDYAAKCLRLRDDGPTPCLCCPDLCVGDRPGHSIAVIVARAERRAWTQSVGAGFIAAILGAALAIIIWH